MDVVDHSRIYRAGPGRLVLENPATFIRADALFVLEILCGDHGEQLRDLWGRFDLVCASPPCQAHSSLRHLQAGKVYPDLIDPVRDLLKRWGGLWCIENVPGAPLGGAHLTQLCGTMFGLQTPDGRAELRRHRLFETSFSIPLRPACQHGYPAAGVLGVYGGRRKESLSVCGSGLDSGKERYRRRAITVTGAKGLPGLSRERRAISVTGNTAQTNTTVRNTKRETFSTADARHAMGIAWMPMKQLSQAIPPEFARWIGLQALAVLESRRRA